MQNFLFVDFETFSLVDLKEVGIDNYAKHASTGVSMLGWALNNDEIQVWLPHRERMSEVLLQHLQNPEIRIIAWNSSFEYNIFKHVLKIPLPLDRFRDPIILSHHLSLPGKLKDVGAILKMQEQKDPRGEELVKMFCKPVSKGGENTLFGIAPPLFRDYNSHPREFAEYVEYCRQDIKSERGLWYRMLKIPLPEIEWRGWLLDQKINEFGMPGNRQLAERALRIAERFVTETRAEIKCLTGVENPNSDSQMKAWLESRGYAWGSLNAKYVQMELDNPESKLIPEARRVLELRKDARKSSYKKLARFLSMLSSDDRLRWQFKYMAAARTGRWASGKTDNTDSSVQVQNMSRGEKAVKKQLARALELVMNEDYEGILREFANVPDKKKAVTPVSLVITLLRSLFQAKPGKKLNVADLNAIENRVLGWMSGCKAIIDVFRMCDECGFLVENLVGSFECPKCGCKKARCPYLSFGTKLYKKTYAEMRATYKAGNEDERQNSKPAVLGAGYCLGGGELYINENGNEVRGGLWGYAKAVCGVDMPKELAHEAVKIFRESYPEVVQLWTDLEEAFKQVLKRGGTVRVGEVTWDKKQREWVEHPTKGKQCVLEFRRLAMEGGGWIIQMILPSGRALHYLNAVIQDETRVSPRTGQPYTASTIYYDGIEHSATEDASGARAKKRIKWGLTKTYGGKLCLSGTTPVVTQRGLVLLSQVTLADRLWDGVQWIEHSGLLDNGIAETQTWMGLTGTSDHQILGGSEWHGLGQTTNRNGLCSLLTGLGSAVRLWYSQNRDTVARVCDVIADKYSMSIPEPYVGTKSTPVLPAGAKLGDSGALTDSDTMSSLTANFANYGSENYQTFSLGAITPKAKPSVTTEEEASSATSHGEKAEDFGWNMPLPSPAGIIQLWNLIESTTTEIMNREISASCLEQRIQTIVEQLYTLLGMAKSFPTKSFADDMLRSGARTLSLIISSAGAPLNGVSIDTTKQRVYDLQNCGPRNRFTVMTSAGPVIAHNCENCCQAISRDLLLNAMLEADALGLNLWGLFHDELASEDDDDVFGLTLEDLLWCMRAIPEWAPGLILDAEGYTGPVYHK